MRHHKQYSLGDLVTSTHARTHTHTRTHTRTHTHERTHTNTRARTHRWFPDAFDIWRESGSSDIPHTHAPGLGHSSSESAEYIPVIFRVIPLEGRANQGRSQGSGSVTASPSAPSPWPSRSSSFSPPSSPPLQAAGGGGGAADATPTASVTGSTSVSFAASPGGGGGGGRFAHGPREVERILLVGNYSGPRKVCLPVGLYLCLSLSDARGLSLSHTRALSLRLSLCILCLPVSVSVYVDMCV